MTEASEKSENAAFTVKPCTLIRYENRAFRKRWLCFFYGWKTR